MSSAAGPVLCETLLLEGTEVEVYGSHELASTVGKVTEKARHTFAALVENPLWPPLSLGGA